MKKVLITTVILVTLLSFSIFSYKFKKNSYSNEFELHVVENIEELSPKLTEWVKIKNKNSGIYICKIDDNKSELLILFNNNYGKNLYVCTRIDVTMHDGNIIVNFVDAIAIDDTYANNNIIAFLNLKSDYKNIEVYHNNIKQNIVFELLNIKNLEKN